MPLLPRFRYHQDPVLSGSIARSETACACCAQARGWIYQGPIYGEENNDVALCPWCIADGTAHARFGLAFADSEDLPDAASPEVIMEVTTRTPRFNTWQSVAWPSCCGEIMTFLEPAGLAEIRARYRALEPQVLHVIVHDLRVSGGAALAVLHALDRDHGPTAFVFQCLHCQSTRAVVDVL